MLFFSVVWQRRHGVWARDKRIPGKVLENVAIRWSTKATESHIPSKLCDCCPCQGRAPWWAQGGGTSGDGALGGRMLGFAPNPALCFPSRLETSPRGVSITALLQCPLWLHTGLSVQVGNCHPEETWSAHRNRSWASPVRSPFGGSAHWGDLDTLIGRGSSWRTPSGLASSSQLVGMDHRASPAVTEAPHWPQLSWGPGLTDRPHSLPWRWLRRRLEMAPDTNKNSFAPWIHLSTG